MKHEKIKRKNGAQKAPVPFETTSVSLACTADSPPKYLAYHDRNCES
ncbi:MAG: hypothetical protein ACXACE_12490 [Candidatus Thorarchaeota archaeon]|jgi:hypothetical protein